MEHTRASGSPEDGRSPEEREAIAQIATVHTPTVAPPHRESTGGVPFPAEKKPTAAERIHPESLPEAISPHLTMLRDAQDTLFKVPNRVETSRRMLWKILGRRDDDWAHVGSGGYADVFRLKESHPSLVFKVLPLYSNLTRRDADAFCRRYNERELETRTHFRSAFGEDAADMLPHEKAISIRTDKRYAVVLLQKFVPAAQEGDSRQLRGGYAEMYNRLPFDRPSNEWDRETIKEHLDRYQRVNELLLQLRPGTFDEEEFLSIQGPIARTIVEAIHADPALRESLRAIVPVMIDHSNKTGAIYDTFGDKNLTLRKMADGSYAPRFIDALLPNIDVDLSHRDVVADLREAIQLNHDHQPLYPKHAYALLMAGNYARMINALAIILGLPDRFHVLDPEFEESNIDFRPIYTIIRDSLRKEKTETKAAEAA